MPSFVSLSLLVPAIFRRKRLGFYLGSGFFYTEFPYFRKH